MFVALFVLVLGALTAQAVAKERRRQRFQQIPLRVAQLERRLTVSEPPVLGPPYDPSH